MTKDEEFGERTRDVGVLLDLREVSKRAIMRKMLAYLLEFVEVRFTFVTPLTGNVMWRFKGLRRLPIFNEATFVSGNDRVIDIAILDSSVHDTCPTA